MSEHASAVDALYTAIERGDLDAAVAACAPDAVFWHNFDGVEQTVEEAAQGWRGLFAHTTEHRIVDVRRQEVPDGLVQRHLFVLRGPDGVRRGKPCCVFVTATDGLLTRLDEYVDVANSVTLTDDTDTTAGLPHRVGVI